MKKIIMKSLLICIIFLITFGSFTFVSATIDTDITIGGTSAISSSKVMTARLLGIVQVIGSIISVIALIIIGIRYMISSVEERASMKGVLVYYIVGAVLVFATTNILSIAYKAISGLKF